jgi:predicted outer membrane repeat protein
MAKKIWLSLAALPMSLLSAQTALGATINLSSTCTFAKAVAWINTPGTPQSGCSRSGSFGSNDTIIVGISQEFPINNTVEIKKSLTVQSASYYGILKTTNTSLYDAIKITQNNISVRFIAIILRGAPGNTSTGFYVQGTGDAYNSFTAKLTLEACRITGFRDSAISIFEGGVDMFSTTLDDNSNLDGYGGAVRIESNTKYGRLNAQYSLFSGNTAQRGGAIYNHGNLQVYGSDFYNNVATRPGGGGTGGVVYAQFFSDNYYTAFSGGGYFENNRANTNGYAISGGHNTEFANGTFIAIGNTSGTNNPPRLCENPFGYSGCPTQ